MAKACMITNVAVVCVVVVVFLGEAGVTEALNCSPLELATCVASITASQPPSKECCFKLREQRPCFCGYLKDPNLKEYVNSPNAKKVASTCGTPTPRC